MPYGGIVTGMAARESRGPAEPPVPLLSITCQPMSGRNSYNRVNVQQCAESDGYSKQVDGVSTDCESGDEVFENDEPALSHSGCRGPSHIVGGAMHLSFDDGDDENGTPMVVQTQTPSRYIARLTHELTNPLFDISEPGGMQIAVDKTFAPRPYWRSWLVRLSFLALSVESLGATLYHTPPWNRWFFMAYLTHWGLVASIAYQICAVICLLPPIRRKALYQPCSEERCSLFVRTTWGLFSLAAPVELIICILYWGLDYSPGHPVHYYLVMNHGGIALLLMLDGFLLSSIPLQLKQLLFTIGFCIAYLTWTLIFAESNISNPNVSDSDDYIYDALEWNANAKVAEILATLCAFVLPPIVFAVFWLMSLSRRHLYDAAEDNDEQEQQIELVGVHAHVNGSDNGTQAASGSNGAVDAAEFTVDDDTEFV